MHPFASSHYRKPLHPDNKTDDTDLEAIFHAAINGYGLASLPVSEGYQSLQRLARHRRNLVKQRARLQIQIRVLMHQAMPGYADLWEDDKLFNNSIALPIAKQFTSAEAITTAKQTAMAKYLRSIKKRFQERTLDKIHAWSLRAADAAPLQELLTEQWKQLAENHALLTSQINETERKTAHFLVQTPYMLLLSVTEINSFLLANSPAKQAPLSTTVRPPR